jgi:hypothetical protein
MPDGDLPRLSVNLSDDVADAVRDLMAQKGVTATELVRLMVSAYTAIQEIQDDPDAMLLVDRAGKLNEIAFG